MISTLLTIVASSALSSYLIFELVELPFHLASHGFSRPLPLRHRLIVAIGGSMIAAIFTQTSDLVLIGLMVIGFSVGATCNSISPLRTISGQGR
jgi:hypothetical protein